MYIVLPIAAIAEIIFTVDGRRINNSFNCDYPAYKIGLLKLIWI